jgi:hypothetical protein
MCVVTVSGFEGREGSGGVVGVCSPVAGSVGGAVRAGVLAHHLHIIGGRVGKSAQRVSGGRGYGLASNGVAGRMGDAPVGPPLPGTGVTGGRYPSRPPGNGP